jgi:hypothetical protein
MSDLFFEDDRAAHMAVVTAITSWKAEVITRNSHGEWISDGLRFATVQEAAAYVADLSSRWPKVRDIAVRPTADAVNACWPPVES